MLVFWTLISHFRTQVHRSAASQTSNPEEEKFPEKCKKNVKVSDRRQLRALLSIAWVTKPLRIVVSSGAQSIWRVAWYLLSIDLFVEKHFAWTKKWKLSGKIPKGIWEASPGSQKYSIATSSARHLEVLGIVSQSFRQITTAASWGKSTLSCRILLIFNLWILFNF